MHHTLCFRGAASHALVVQTLDSSSTMESIQQHIQPMQLATPSAQQNQMHPAAQTTQATQLSAAVCLLATAAPNTSSQPPNVITVHMTPRSTTTSKRHETHHTSQTYTTRAAVQPCCKAPRSCSLLQNWNPRPLRTHMFTPSTPIKTAGSRTPQYIIHRGACCFQRILMTSSQSIPIAKCVLSCEAGAALLTLRAT
jgi:hypothetical protein